VRELREINAGIALSTEDFSPDRALAVRQLNAAGISTIAVIVLDHKDGYYVNADNASATAHRFTEFDKWSTDNGLRWEAVGLDIEPSLKEWSDINAHKLRFAGVILSRLLESNRQIDRTRRLYAALIRKSRDRSMAVAIIVELKSTPIARPVGSTNPARVRTSSPVPHPRSATVSPP
jgi:hypothetical protein